MIQYTESGPVYNGRTFRTVQDASLAEWFDQFGVNWGYEEACFHRMDTKFPRRVSTSFILPEIRTMVFTANYGSPSVEMDFLLSLPHTSWDDSWMQIYTAAPNIGVHIHTAFEQMKKQGEDVEGQIIPNLPNTPYLYYCYQQKDNSQDPYIAALPILALRDRLSDYGQKVIQMPVSNPWRMVLGSISKGEQLPLGKPTERTHAWTTELALRASEPITAQSLQHMAQTRTCPGCNRMQFSGNHPGLLRKKCPYCQCHLFMLGRDSSMWFSASENDPLSQQDLMELVDTIMVVIQYLDANSEAFLRTAKEDFNTEVLQGTLGQQALFYTDVMTGTVADHRFNGLSVLALASALFLTQGKGEGWLPGNPSPGMLDELSQRNSMPSPLCPSTATVAQRKECNARWAMLPAILDSWLTGHNMDMGGVHQIRQALREVILNLQRDGLAHWRQYGLNGLDLTP